jgi:alanine racemase
MNCLGLAPDSVRGVYERLQACGNAGELTLMTHFANADDPRGIEWQLEIFRRATAGLDLPVSTSNSPRCYVILTALTDGLGPASCSMVLRLFRAKRG